MQREKALRHMRIQVNDRKRALLQNSVMAEARVETNAFPLAAHGSSGRVPQNLANSFDGTERTPIAPEKAAMVIRASPIVTRNTGRMGDSGQERVLRVFNPVVNILLGFAPGERFEKRIGDSGVAQ